MRNVAENERLKKELASERQRLDELEASFLQVKEDVILITKDKQIVEEENRRLKADLKKEKAKGKRSRERLVLLHNDLSDQSLKNERLHTALNEATQSLIKMVEKRHLVEAHLPKHLDHLVKETQRTYLESDEFIKMFNRASALILWNGWRMGIAQVQRMLEDDDPLIPELDQLKLDVNVPFAQEKIDKIEKKPVEWTEAYDARVSESIEEWGKEIEEMFPIPPTSETSNIALQTQQAPDVPSTSDVLLLPSSKLIAPLPPTENDYENEVLIVMDLKEELYDSQLRLKEELEKIRAIMISYAILEDTSTSSSDKQDEDPSPIVVEDPMSAIVVYKPPPSFEEKDRESVEEFEMSTSEDVDSLFDN
ncbi:hypothetical protein Dimus_030699 [Dionaea muscipula]